MREICSTVNIISMLSTIITIILEILLFSDFRTVEDVDGRVIGEGK